MTGPSTPRRALILAGGGLKVAYQAGCLQVLLDEYGLEFHHVDATSGGNFNAAMMAMGWSGKQIADAWRALHPRDFVTLNFREYYKLIWASALGTSRGVRRVIDDVWGLDFRVINRNPSERDFTFNHFNFAQKTLVALPAEQLDIDYLVASATLLMWQPPVQKRNPATGRDEFLFDAVWLTDGNVGEAVRRGADEVWALWTVTESAEMRSGFIAQYFHLIETIADARFRDDWAEIAAVNAAIDAAKGPDTSRMTPDLRLQSGTYAAGLPPPPGRKRVVQHLIRQEVSLQYLFNFNRDRVAAAVELGVRDARAYAQREKLVARTRPFAVAQPPTRSEPIVLTYSEWMNGWFAPGVDSGDAGERAGRNAGNRLRLNLTITIDDLDHFITDPEHAAKVSGTVDCPLLCGAPAPIAGGTFNLFVNLRDADGVNRPGKKRMRYEISFKAADGTAYILRGHKKVRNAPHTGVWKETTTCYVRLYREGTGEPALAGAGIVHVRPLGFARELTTFRVGGGAYDTAAKAAAMRRYLEFFFGQAWDVYARPIVDYSPL